MFIGTAASYAIHFIYDPITMSVKADTIDPIYLLRLISLGILSGFMGIKVLSTLSDTFLQQLQNKSKQILDQMHTQQRSRELLVFTDNSLQEIDQTANTDVKRALTDLDNAEAGIDQILEQNPNDAHAMVIKGKVYKRRWQYTGKTKPEFLNQAVQILSTAVKADPLYDRAVYNRACYYALLGKSDDALKDIEQAVKLFSQNRFFAKDDPDLVSLKNSPQWKKIVDAL
jgi:tetratricopeptide (TPR) repeat protein